MSSDRCYQCNTKFSFFKKGKPCRKCALLHCDVCLTSEVTEGQKLFTCRRCIESVKSQEVREPPKAFIERMKKQTELTQPNNLGPTGENTGGQPNAGISRQPRTDGVPTDAEITARLAKLSQGSGTTPATVPTDDHLRDRLNRLKESLNPPTSDQTGFSSSSSNSSHGNTGQSRGPNDIHLQQDPIKTPDDLIGQIRGELAVDGGQQKSSNDVQLQPDPVNTPDDLIAKMRGELAVDAGRKAASGVDLDPDEEEDEEAATRKLIQKILEEDALEREMGCRLPVPSTSDPGTSQPRNWGAEEERELPWCVVCNEDATVRCVDPECQASLYCLRCFAEDHSDSDRRHHAKIKYSRNS